MKREVAVLMRIALLLRLTSSFFRAVASIILVWACLYLPGDRAVLWLRGRLDLRAEVLKEA